MLRKKGQGSDVVGVEGKTWEKMRARWPPPELKGGGRHDGIMLFLLAPTPFVFDVWGGGGGNGGDHFLKVFGRRRKLSSTTSKK